jgi:hypothetical protein
MVNDDLGGISIVRSVVYTVLDRITNCVIECGKTNSDPALNLDGLTDTVVSGNLIINGQVVIASTTYAYGLRIYNNTFYFNNNGIDGITISSASQFISIVGNIFSNTGCNADAVSLTNCSQIIITNNVFSAFNTASQYAVREVAPSNLNLIANNVCFNCNSPAILTAGADTVVGDNIN